MSLQPKSPAKKEKGRKLKGSPRPQNVPSAPSQDSVQNHISNGQQHYRIGNEIGRGSFSTVFEAVNVDTGDFYAIKRFSLKGTTFSAESIDSIEVEIELMRRLNHPNIVKYVDTIRAEDYLYIILEFVEKGSLANIVRQFNFCMNESLVAYYVFQIVLGLQYLHDQGVIHRDIKAANILTTKDGLVKLADFGVSKLSQNLSDGTAEEGVGSPYWMAPEVIFSDTSSSSCDIWSLGCTVIELLTGKPPYFDLNKIAAMYQIVKAECPPLPENISVELRQFLLSCFKHNPDERATANALLQHPWLEQAKLRHATVVGPVAGTISVGGSSSKSIADGERFFGLKSPNYGTEVESFDLTDTSRKQVIRRSASLSSLNLLAAESGRGLQLKFTHVVQDDGQRIDYSRSDDVDSSRRAEDISSTFQCLSTDDGIYGPEDVPTLTLVPAESANREVVVEEGSCKIQVKSDFILSNDGQDDIVASEIRMERDNLFRRTVDIVRLMNFIRPGNPPSESLRICSQIIAQLDADATLAENLVSCHGITPIVELLDAQCAVHSDVLSSLDAEVRRHTISIVNKIVDKNAGILDQLAIMGIVPIIVKLFERANASFENSASISGIILQNPQLRKVLNSSAFEAAKYIHTATLRSPLSARMLIGAGGASVFVAMVAYSGLLLRNLGTAGSVSKLHDSAEASVLTGSWTSLVEHAASSDEMAVVCMGVDCLMEMVSSKEVQPSDSCRLLLRLGMLPHISIAFRVILTQYMSSIWVSDMSNQNYLARAGGVQLKSIGDSSADEPSLVHAIYHKYSLSLVNLFVLCSQSGTICIEKMASSAEFVEVVLFFFQSPLFRSTSVSSIHIGVNRQRIGGNLPTPFLEVIEMILRVIKNITTESDMLDHLENSGILVCLVHLLNARLPENCENLVLHSIFNLCRLSRRRQELAAQHGIIPHLKVLITEASQFKHLALPIVLDLAHTSNATRLELWKHDMVPFYFTLLEDRQTLALSSLAVWLYHSNDDVENMLIDPSNICILVSFFCSVAVDTLRLLHKPLLDMMTKSERLSRSLSSSSVFVSGIIDRLKIVDAVVLRSLLNMLQILHRVHVSPRQLVLDYDLYSTVKAFANSESRVLVNQIALKLLVDIQASTLT